MHKSKSYGFRFVRSATSDIGWEAYGKDLKEVFENSAKALFTVMCKMDRVLPKKKQEFKIAGENEGDLLLNWLQALIASVDIDGIFYSGFYITKITRTSLSAVCTGEPISKSKGNTVVKAVTYHGFEFRKTKWGYTAKVVVDI